jgi:uncharacterized Zn finger protein (UPF0148 family)
MKVIRCKRCNERMWDDDDGTVYCGTCGWEVGTVVDEPTGQFLVFDNYPEYAKNTQGIF